MQDMKFHPKRNKRIGFTCSTFDLLHAGHILMLQECKSHCDYLICGLQIDPTIDRKEKNKPIQTVYERWVQLKAVKWVDEIIPYSTEEELCQILLSQNLDVRILGEEYKDKPFTGKEICETRGIQVIFNSRQHKFSSTELRNRIKNV